MDVPFYQRFRKVRNAGFSYIEFGSWEQHDVKIIKDELYSNNLRLGIMLFDKISPNIDILKIQSQLLYCLVSSNQPPTRRESRGYLRLVDVCTGFKDRMHPLMSNYFNGRQVRSDGREARERSVVPVVPSQG